MGYLMLRMRRASKMTGNYVIFLMMLTSADTYTIIIAATLSNCGEFLKPAAIAMITMQNRQGFALGGGSEGGASRTHVLLHFYQKPPHRCLMAATSTLKISRNIL